MKKLILIGALLVSAAAFSMGPYYGGSQGCGGVGIMYPSNPAPVNLPPGPRAPLNVSPQVKKALDQKVIALEEKQLELRKALNADDIDWQKVDKLNKEIGQMEAEIKTQLLKLHHEAAQQTPPPPPQQGGPGPVVNQ